MMLLNRQQVIWKLNFKKKIKKTSGLSSDKYVYDVINNVDESVKKRDKRIPTKVRTPMKSDFAPEGKTL